jgi:hypothetical protein
VRNTVRTLSCGAALVLLAGFGVAQTPDDDPLKVLKNGQLVVWVVRAGAAPTQAPIPGLLARQPMGYTEQTTGEFGQTASSYGQTAGSYGKPSDTAAIGTPPIPAGADAAVPPSDEAGYHEQTSGSFGQTSGSFGTVASDHGQTASSLGQTAGSYGTAASNHGQTAGSFGNSLSTIAHAGDTPNQPPSALLLQLQGIVQQAFPQLHVQYADVREGDLAAKRKVVEGTSAYPDVIVGLPASVPPDVYKRYVLATVVSADSVDSTSASPPALVMLRAPHKAAAKAFALWLGEGANEDSVAHDLSVTQTAVATIAQSAMLILLQDEDLGDVADPKMAKLPPQQALLMQAGTGKAEDAMPRVDVMSVRINGALAAVALRVVVSSDREVGVTHPLMVLRKSEDGNWRVLQVSLDLSPREQKAQGAQLMSTRPALAEQKAGVLGVKLAAPLDGETRPPQPELWWDNGGGSGLQVIEWQRGLGSHLFLVPDQAARLQTRVTATFAKQPGTYRWRVWSVGVGGAMKISPWSTMKIAR